MAAKKTEQPVSCTRCFLSGQEIESFIRRQPQDFVNVGVLLSYFYTQSHKTQAYRRMRALIKNKPLQRGLDARAEAGQVVRQGKRKDWNAFGIRRKQKSITNPKETV